MMVQRAEAEDVLAAIAWAKARGIGPLPTDVFSPTGFVVRGLAGLWLYTTNSTIAYLDMLVSNPDAPKDRRRLALDLVIDACADAAKKAGCRAVMGPCNRDDVEARYVARGFVVLGRSLSLIAKPLGGPSCP